MSPLCTLCCGDSWNGQIACCKELAESVETRKSPLQSAASWRVEEMLCAFQLLHCIYSAYTTKAKTLSMACDSLQPNGVKESEQGLTYILQRAESCYFKVKHLDRWERAYPSVDLGNLTTLQLCRNLGFVVFSSSSENSRCMLIQKS